tara:strand:- start:2601 stop:4511 length:1911 start_codon:yes stop_codon:yes gene_type:complete
MPLSAQKWTLADLKHFTGTGYQTVEAVVAGSAGESYVMVSWEDKFEYSNQINLLPANYQAIENLTLLKIAKDGSVEWYRHLYSLNQLDYRDMIFVDSVGVIILFDQKGLAYFEYRVGSAARSAGAGDFTIVNYAENGNINWNNRFDADQALTVDKRNAFLAPSDSGFFVCFSHEGFFDADVMSSNVSNTADGGGLNVSLMEYNFQLGLQRHVTWTTPHELIVQGLASNQAGKMAIAFRLTGQVDADSRPNVNLALSSPVISGGYTATNYIIGLDEATFGVDWHNRIQTSGFCSIDEIVFDAAKAWWWVAGVYKGDIQTFDSPSYSHTPQFGATYDYDSFYFAFDQVGNRSFTGALQNSYSDEIAGQFIPSPEGYLLMAQSGGMGDLDFRLNETLSGNRNLSAVLISHFDTSLTRDWAHLRMEQPLRIGNSTLQHAARLGSRNYLFGFSAYGNGPTLNVGFNLDSSSVLRNVLDRDGILAQWLYCEAADTSISYREGVFYANDTTADLYEWVSCFDGAVLASGPQPFWEPEYRTWAYLRMTKNQCVYRSECITANDVGLKEWSAQLNIYPNPAQGQFRVEWEGKEPLQLSLYNSQGQFLQHYEFAAGKHLVHANFPHGVYFLRDTQNPAFNVKLILH